MKISARNQLPGTVASISPGAVNSQIIIRLSDGLEVVSIITNESVSRLGLEVGQPAFAVIKASDVMVAVD